MAGDCPGHSESRVGCGIEGLLPVSDESERCVPFHNRPFI